LKLGPGDNRDKRALLSEPFFIYRLPLYIMKDNFSKQAAVYAKYRPTYPQELFTFILSHVKNKQVAWDCGTGNGQSAKELAKYFEKVFATDISQKQIDKAHQAANIFYSVQPAEQTNFPDNSFDLITVSQALHWFKVHKFYIEVKRIAKPGAWIAVWMYNLPAISPEIDELLNVQLYKKTLGAYWDYERKYVDDNYTTLLFPFKEIQTPVFKIQFDWTFKELGGYINSWSALQKFIQANQFNPVDELIKKIQPYWSARTPLEEKEKMKIVFPVYIRMGQIGK
jgi:ubiquinone/menaquinone biosynthesis C-methylase UbiE